MGLWLKVDASRRQNDPRKPDKVWRAWCGLEVSPTGLSERGQVTGINLRQNLQLGGCGVKNQVSLLNMAFVSNESCLFLYFPTIFPH